ncbi:hypothetical protein ACC808_37605, partial [Rhizobium ruizarguesonis]
RDGEARYSTVEMVVIEGAMATSAGVMKTRQNHGVFKRHVDAAIAAQDRSIEAAGASSSHQRMLPSRLRSRPSRPSNS